MKTTKKKLFFPSTEVQRNFVDHQSRPDSNEAFAGDACGGQIQSLPAGREKGSVGAVGGGEKGAGTVDATEHEQTENRQSDAKESRAEK